MTSHHAQAHRAIHFALSICCVGLAPHPAVAANDNKPARAAATVPATLRAEMVDFGLYEISRYGRQADDQVAGGLVQSLGKKLILASNTVPAKLGTSFGFRYWLHGPGSEAEVRIRVLHPQPLHDPATGQRLAYSEWSQSVPVGQVNWNTGWLFEHAWELVPGAWTMQLYAGQTLLLEKRFDVVKPGSAP